MPLPDRATFESTSLLAASYARRAERLGNGLTLQHEANAQCAADDGWRLPEGTRFRFTDDGYSGLSLERPGLKALLRVVASGPAPFSRLYIRDRSRLTLEPDFHLFHRFEQMMRANGVEVCYASDRLEAGMIPLATLIALMGPSYLPMDGLLPVRERTTLTDMRRKDRPTAADDSGCD